MLEKETSDLAISRVQCLHCKAIWINGKHYWSTGCTSAKSDLDLAGLVCNTPHGNTELCINPKKGKVGGDTWEERMKLIKTLDSEMKDQ